MRRPRQWLPPLFTLLLVAAGAVMPFAASYMQDTQQVGAEVRPFDSFSLTLQQKSNLGQTLRVIADGSYYIDEAAKAENTALTEGLALEAAKAVLDELEKHDLLTKEVREQLSGPQIWAQTVIPGEADNAGMNTAVLPGPDNGEDVPAAARVGAWDEEDAISTWTVTWNAPNRLYIWLDDASSKALLISLPSYVPTDSGRTSLTENWRLFVEDYYGVEAALSGPHWKDELAQYMLSFPLGEDGEVFRLRLNLYPDGYASLRPWK